MKQAQFFKKIGLTAVLGVGVLALALASQVSAQANKQGPRASLLSATACALNLPGNGKAFLVVTTTLTNKSSGNTVPEVRNGSMIQGTFKDQNERGQAFKILDTVLITAPQDVDPILIGSAEFQLCNADGTVIDEVQNARELNGLSTVFYGISGGKGETRPVTNQCTDDPNTPDVNEGGIKVADVFDTIAAACTLPQ